jgi:hypothetical protein
LFSTTPHADAQRRNRKFNVGRVVVVNTHPARVPERAAHLGADGEEARLARVELEAVQPHRQGLTLVHLSAQLQPFLTRNTP